MSRRDPFYCYPYTGNGHRQTCPTHRDELDELIGFCKESEDVAASAVCDSSGPVRETARVSRASGWR